VIHVRVTWRSGDAKPLVSHVALPAERAEEFAASARIAFLSEPNSMARVVTVQPMSVTCGGTTHDESECPERKTFAEYVAWSGGIALSFREWLGIGELPDAPSGPGCETVTAERSA
jgi:hypothetical protein